MEDQILAVGYVLSFVVVVALLHWIVPASVVTGYVRDRKGSFLVYRLNGLIVLILTVVGALILTSYGLFPMRFLADNFWACCHVGNGLGLITALIFYIKGKRLPPSQQENEEYALTAHMKKKEDTPTPTTTTKRTEQQPQQQQHGFFYDYYTGLEFNPRIGLFDHKMFLYLIGAVLLEFIIISAAYVQWQTIGDISLEMKVYVFLFSFFVAEYLYHEHVHLYTYDLFAEKLGFKLIWGCFCFYPFFYPIGVWPILQYTGKGASISTLTAVLAIVCFFTGWILSRGANNQKYLFKVNPKTKFMGFIAPRTVGNKLLCSGWWALSRHINYLGEVLMAIGLAIPGGFYSWTPWLYPLYYVALLFPRERADNDICAKKYGALWKQYCDQVPYRIIPFIYSSVGGA